MNSQLLTPHSSLIFMVIRPMISEDLVQVAAIDAVSMPSPWSKELFEAELKSILEGTEFNLAEVEKITIRQLAPKLAEPEKPAKPVKEIDWNAQGVSCPCCGCTISQEKYQRLKEKFSKYPGLFAE